MKVLSIILIFCTIPMNGMGLVKKAIHAIIPSSPKLEQDCLDLNFYKAFKELPSDVKRLIWYSYNETEGTIHEAGEFIVPFDQYFSDEFIEKHVVRYKDPDYWDARGDHSSLPIRKINRDINENVSLLYVREDSVPKKDTWPILSAYGVGPNSKSNIKVQWFGKKLKFELIEDQQVWLKNSSDLESKKKLYCIHPEKNQFLVGSPVSILSVVNVGSTPENVTTELKEIQVADPSDDSTIRFGPLASIFIKKRHEDVIAHYDYEKQKLFDIIDVKQFFNDYVQRRPNLHKEIYDQVCKSMHRQYSSDPKCSPQYTATTSYLIGIEDFVYPTASSDYLLIKFNAKLPYCSCCRKPINEDSFGFIFEDHFVLYNLKTKTFTYIGNKRYRSKNDSSGSLPNFKSIKQSGMYTYVYDFINHQSDGNSHMFCLDNELNVNSDQKYNKFPSRKMVAIVPDDDIARLEQMMIAGIAKRWCSKDSSHSDKGRSKGFEILKYLNAETVLLEQKTNPFKHKRVALLKKLMNQMAEADKLNIDLQSHIKQHLNQ